MMRFLLASDEARTRLGIAAAGERAGHEVVCVTHPRLAAERSDLRLVDVVVVAFGHPLRTEQFVRRVRARHATIPIAVLLNRLAAAAARRMEPWGATVVLASPVAVAELVERLEQLAGGNRRTAEPTPSAAVRTRRGLEPRGMVTRDADRPRPALMGLAGAP